MTIPIAPVNIHPAILEGNATDGVALLISALQHKHALAQEQQKIDQAQQEFELHKKLVGSEIAGNEVVTAQKKQELKDRQDDLDAQRAAAAIVMGHFDALGDPQKFAEGISADPRIKDPKVLGYVMATEKGYLANLHEFSQANLTGAQATAATQANTNSAQVQAVLGKYGDRLSDPKVFPKAWGEVAAVDPAAAERLVSGFNATAGEWQSTQLHDGQLILVNRKTGEVKKTGINGGPTGGTSATNQKLKVGAIAALAAIDQMEALWRADPDATAKPTIGDLAQATLGKVGLGTSTRQRILGAKRAEFQMAATSFGHSWAGLLGGQRSMLLFQSVMDSRIPSTGAPRETRDAAMRHLVELKPILNDLISGKNLDITTLPGFKDAARILAASDAPDVPSDEDIQSFRNPPPEP